MSQEPSAFKLPPQAHAAVSRLLKLGARLLGVPAAALWAPRADAAGAAPRTRLDWLCLQTWLSPDQGPLVYPGPALHPPAALRADEPRFFVGLLLRQDDGQPLAVLYGAASTPGPPLDDDTRAALADLGALLVHELGRASPAVPEPALQALAEHTSDAAYVKDRAGRYLWVNPAASALLGLAPARLLGQTDETLFGPQASAELRALEQRVMTTRVPEVTEREVQRAGGPHIYQLTTVPVVEGGGAVEGGAVEGVVGLGRDITDRRRRVQAIQDVSAALSPQADLHTQTLARLALEDPVTGLRNRRAFDADLEAYLAQLAPGDGVSLLLLDVNAFKAWNDVHGHAAGDTLLRALGAALQAHCAAATVYRLGGDEFALLQPGPAPGSLRECVRAAERAVQAQGFAELSCAAGLARAPAEATTPSTLARLADQRMLHEKAARRADQGLGNLTGAPPDDRALELAGEVTFGALRATLALLAHDTRPEQNVWAPLLEAAVAAVPGAESGSLSLREGDSFVLQAQVGFSSALVGVRQPAAAAHVWYGAASAPQVSRARVLTRREISQRLRAAAANEEWTRARPAFETHGELTHIQANVCVPVVQGGEVVAYLNLDNLQNHAAFSARSADIAEAFATQIAALLAAQRRQAQEAARRRELEGLLSVTAALREVAHSAQAQGVLAQQAAALLGTAQATLWCPAQNQPPLPRPQDEALARQALATRTVMRWPPPEEPASNPAAQSAAAQEPAPAVMAAPLWRANGEPLAALVVSRPHPPFSELDAQLLGGIAAIGTTTLERLEGVEALRRRAEEFQKLSDLSHLTATLTDPAQVARRILAECRSFLGAEVAAFLDIDGQPVVTDGHASPGLLAALGAPQVLAPDGQMTAPVQQDGLVVGQVGLLWRPARPLPHAARPLLDRAAELIGQALERRAHLAALEATQEGALLTLGLALELRDFETAGHTRRVVRQALALGAALGLGPEELEGLRQGAYLHDIGKLAVPDRILLKPGPLDPDEWRVMQEHAAVGDGLTRSIATLHPLARAVIRHHHERWDGRGYPDGLAGAAIPLVARVFSVVDTYDALTSHRVYKAAWPPEAAILELQAQAGHQFDPVIVAVFIQLLRAQPDPLAGLQETPAD
ncbi:HD domain-containing phosphohydrolase [Deinococcus multiflagellatus]|uniref:HD domain-containing phosphohydrolase n=1 Tax=Deinococcus multiflagellatus TaxID=1656887 RepID=UPI001CCE7656|nr:HD domain-containing phosphohydrolase [Deinococcus multiflagellatus]MBZ9712266.1 diguanylate cyclase [Deinococcus multiflagellatus]